MGKEISHVAVKKDASLGWIGRAERVWEVGFDRVTGATEARCVASNANPPVGDRMVRAPGDEEMIRGRCCPRSPGTTMEGKLAAAGGSHKFFVCLTTRLFSPQFTSCCHGALISTKVITDYCLMFHEKHVGIKESKPITSCHELFLVLFGGTISSTSE